MSVEFSTNRLALLSRLQQVAPVHYGKTRNFLDGAVSRLSPYLTHGALSLPQVARSVVAAHGLQSAKPFLFQLAWREFFHRTWRRLGDKVWQGIKQPQAQVEREGVPLAIQDAETGIDALDKQIIQLLEIGYMHNHARMWFASLACNIARAHWKQPSHWMYYHLLDGDLASNTLSWQWVAGTLSKRKYLANQDNINKYAKTEQRGTIVDCSYEELAALTTPRMLQEVIPFELKTTLPRLDPPELDSTRDLLLYHPWSLDPEWRKDDDAERVLVLEPSHFFEYPVSEKRIAFLLKLAKNIRGLKVFVGEVAALPGLQGFGRVVSIDYPACSHFPGAKDPYPLLFPGLDGDFPSFYSFWKRAERVLDRSGLTQ